MEGAMLQMFVVMGDRMDLTAGTDPIEPRLGEMIDDIERDDDRSTGARNP